MATKLPSVAHTILMWLPRFLEGLFSPPPFSNQKILSSNKMAAMRYDVLTAVLTGTFRRVDWYIVTDGSNVTVYISQLAAVSQKT
jgi:hypothetical protein